MNSRRKTIYKIECSQKWIYDCKLNFANQYKGKITSRIYKNLTSIEMKIVFLFDQHWKMMSMMLSFVMSMAPLINNIRLHQCLRN